MNEYIKINPVGGGGGGGSGASTALDNLMSVAINASLLPGTDATISLGSGSFTWLDVWASGNVNLSNSSTIEFGDNTVLSDTGTGFKISNTGGTAGETEIYSGDNSGMGLWGDTALTNGVQISSDGSSIGMVSASVTIGSFDNSSTAGDTRFLLWDVDNASLVRVSVGAADSGGTGFKVLRIPN